MPAVHSERAEEAVLAQERRLRKEALDREKREVDRQHKQLDEYMDTGDLIKDKISELEDLIKNPEEEKYLKKLAEAKLPNLRLELSKIEAGLPKRQEVFKRFEGEWLVGTHSIMVQRLPAPELASLCMRCGVVRVLGRPSTKPGRTTRSWHRSVRRPTRRRTRSSRCGRRRRTC
jgi:hypothetical protein